jgi:hypothetical protein
MNKLFSMEIFQLLSGIAKYDFVENCKYLTFVQYTACAFHLLRETKALI